MSNALKRRPKKLSSADESLLELIDKANRGELPSAKKLLDAEVFLNEKMPLIIATTPPRAMMELECQVSVSMITTRIDRRFNFRNPQWLDDIIGASVAMLRRCKHCGKIFLASRKDAQFCRPTNRKPSSCRNIFNLRKCRKTQKQKELMP